MPNNTPTPEENKLAAELRKRGASIVQQHPFYYAPSKKFHTDIVIPSAKLAIEVDGGHHTGRAKQVLSDAKRDDTMREQGFKVIHVGNSLVRSDGELRALADQIVGEYVGTTGRSQTKLSDVPLSEPSATPLPDDSYDDYEPWINRNAIPIRRKPRDIRKAASTEKVSKKKKFSCDTCGRPIWHRGNCLPCNDKAMRKRRRDDKTSATNVRKRERMNRPRPAPPLRAAVQDTRGSEPKQQIEEVIIGTKITSTAAFLIAIVVLCIIAIVWLARPGPEPDAPLVKQETAGILPADNPTRAKDLFDIVQPGETAAGIWNKVIKFDGPNQPYTEAWSVRPEPGYEVLIVFDKNPYNEMSDNTGTWYAPNDATILNVFLNKGDSLLEQK